MWKGLLIFSLLFCFGPLRSQSYDYSDEIKVYFFLGEDCKICQYYSIELRSLYNSFHTDSIQFVGLFPNRYSSESGIQSFKEKYNIPFELKREYFQTKTKLFEVKVTPEVVVYDEVHQQILYKGRIDDSYVRVGKRKRVVQQKELRDALESVLDKMPILVNETTPIGCFITFVEN